MSQEVNKTIYLNIKDLVYKREQMVVDLIRYLTEQLPQIQLTRTGNEVELIMPIKLSKRAIRLRIRKFLYKKGLNEDFRPISFKNPEKEGYTVKEKKYLSMQYY